MFVGDKITEKKLDMLGRAFRARNTKGRKNIIKGRRTNWGRMENFAEN
jgi:hypothetical protein